VLYHVSHNRGVCSTVGVQPLCPMTTLCEPLDAQRSVAIFAPSRELCAQQTVAGTLRARICCGVLAAAGAKLFLSAHLIGQLERWRIGHERVEHGLLDTTLFEGVHVHHPLPVPIRGGWVPRVVHGNERLPIGGHQPVPARRHRLEAFWLQAAAGDVVNAHCVWPQDECELYTREPC
jgi:hypothetical protein